MYSLDDFLLDLRNRGENAPLDVINTSAINPTPVPQLQGDIANMDFSNFNYEDIDNANIYEKDGLYYSDNPYVNSIIGIESGHKANAHNASGAAGVFQFMPSTAKQYKLTNAYDPNESLRATGRGVMPHTDIAIFRGLGEGAEAHLVLTAAAFPSQFEHTLIEQVVQGE